MDATVLFMDTDPTKELAAHYQNLLNAKKDISEAKLAVTTWQNTWTDGKDESELIVFVTEVETKH